MLSAAQFIQRQRALALWREIVRSTANIPDNGARKDMRQFARSEFEQHRNVTDLVSTLSPGSIKRVAQLCFRVISGISFRYASDVFNAASILNTNTIAS
jgi:hypothetical protein